MQLQDCDGEIHTRFLLKLKSHFTGLPLFSKQVRKILILRLSDSSSEKGICCLCVEVGELVEQRDIYLHRGRYKAGAE